jgi:hypothetical protein
MTTSETPAAPRNTEEQLVRRGYRVAQAMTAEGLQAIVNNLLAAGFEPVGGVSVTLIGTMHEEPIVLHTQGLFYTPNMQISNNNDSQQGKER